MKRRTWPLALVSFSAALTLASTAVGQTSGDRKTIGVVSAQDRWITLTDGTRVYQGAEISYLLVTSLMASNQYNTILLPPANPVAAVSTERFKDVPPEWIQPAMQASQNPPIAPMAFTVTPVVEALTYASGDRSDRVVAGFSPVHLNPFNEGKAGALDNEFIASPKQQSDCVLPDFFNGTFTPQGYGPFAGNYGSNLDEGATFQIGGYGFGFKQFYFQVDSQIRFIIKNLKTGAAHDLIFQTKGYGQDIFVSGSYQGFTLGVTIQRRETLLQALTKMLPQIVDDVIKNGFGDTPPAAADLGAVSAQTTFTEDGTPETVIQKDIPLKFDQKTRASQQVAALAACFNKTTDWVEDAIDSIALPYALLKYESILDQPLQPPSTNPLDPILNPKPAPTPVPPPSNLASVKIAVIDSGIDYNDNILRPYVQLDAHGNVVGYDVISGDPRPSDDNGHGTAVAKYLLQLLGNRPFTYIPIKAVGSHGETHSSAIYDSFVYAVNAHPDAILVAWASTGSTQAALKMGSELATQAGIPVFAATPAPAKASMEIPLPPVPIPTPGPAPVPPAYTTTGLGKSNLTLDSVSTGAISKLVQSLPTH